MITGGNSRGVLSLKVYYEDKDIIVVHKKAYISSQAVQGGEMDLESLIKKYIYDKEKKINPYVAVVHRLDKPVEGIMVYAKTKTAAKNLSGQIQDRGFKKTYLAVVTGRPENKEYEMVENYLAKDCKNNKSLVVDKSHKDAKKAVLEYRALGVNKEGNAVLEVLLHTGRHHQIRVTLSSLGYPIVGDVKYGNFVNNQERFAKKDSVQLCAYKLEFNHPVSGKRMEFISEINDIYKVVNQ